MALAAGTELWFQVSMSNTIVYQIELKAQMSNSEDITVSLYSGETLAGQCQSHTVSGGTETLSCDRVTADRVRLTVSSTITKSSALAVYEITVTGVPTMTIGLYLVSARIISPKTMRTFRDGVECLVYCSALVINHINP